ncbi:metalloprotease family protein [Thermoflexus sp.]|jgi:hypothetical protein|uniref:metalloprotease family protein n=1 Tax=Thermoflexus sp. TaxID=1969742 RepID=UPI003C0AA0D0
MTRDAAPAPVHLLADGAMASWIWGVIVLALLWSLFLALIFPSVSPADLESLQTLRARADLRPYLEALIAFPIGILFHELVHLLAFRAFGYRALFNEFFPLLRIPRSVHVPEPIRRDHYILGLCAPAAAALPILAAGWIALLLAPTLPGPLRFLLLVATISFSVASDDIGRAFALLRRPSWVLLEDAPHHPSCRPVDSPAWWTADPLSQPLHPFQKIAVGLLFFGTAMGAGLALATLLNPLLARIAYLILHR